MKTLFILLPLIILLILKLIINSSNNNSKNQSSADFWMREHQAKFARNKDISNLELFTPSTDSLPFHSDTDDETLLKLEVKVAESSSQPMIDLHEYTNTDLKLMYGNGNFPTISRYDQNFMYFTRDLFQWGKYLYENDYKDDSKAVLEYLISISTDNGSAFTILANIYCADNKPEKITYLISIVESTEDSLIKKSTLNSLRNIINSY